MPLSFHHHMGTAVETEKDLDNLMQNTNETVKLLFDPGHMAFAGGNIINVIKKYGKRINHFHAKDVRNEVLNSLNREKESFLDAVLRGFYCSRGWIPNYTDIISNPKDVGHEGWFVVEAEQTQNLPPP